MAAFPINEPNLADEERMQHRQHASRDALVTQLTAAIGDVGTDWKRASSFVFAPRRDIYAGDKSGGDRSEKHLGASMLTDLAVDTDAGRPSGHGNKGGSASRVIGFCAASATGSEPAQAG